jgi:hypothetical protein
MSKLYRNRPVAWHQFVVLVAFVAGGAHADVYKWSDTEGRLHYTDRPPPAEGHLIAVTPTGSRPAEAVSATRPAADHPSGPTPLPPPDAATQTRLEKAVAADRSHHSAEACQQAQERYRLYIGARHLYRDGDVGARIILSDAEADVVRRDARRDVEELCESVP